jgi:leader peptidase (prepilin peptidase)/N-methyltransferase
MGVDAGLLAGVAAGAGGAVLGLVAGFGLANPVQIVSSSILAAMMAAIAAVDARSLRVPNSLNVVVALGGGIATWLGAGAPGESLAASAVAAVLGALLCGGSLLALREGFFRLRGVDGLGLGDVKLAAAGGIWVGWQLFAVAVLLAALGALATIGFWSIAKGPWQRTSRIPFAAYLAPAIWLVWYLAARQILA